MPEYQREPRNQTLDIHPTGVYIYFEFSICKEEFEGIFLGEVVEKIADEKKYFPKCILYQKDLFEKVLSKSK